ncbi:hypothetical protein GALMADRAFT_247333 [Galerina marginata CBS 339.88]|uniref:Uncharacterized protein n=1 Tax=Galerina marginata (strain CBS 339.88) TaxID=685588 RepID=A0A067SZ12_GALM3|nr:hypothetical protein GALMADRAFT_247333 [Galerina marginata CBS 339.88]
MPTATATTVTRTALYPAQLPLKVGLKPSAPSSPAKAPTPPSPKTAQNSTTATLRSLYNRAARAFVLRDIPLTYSLIRSAFDLLKPPSSASDSLSDHRRKWDILRITFEATVYTSPPSAAEFLPDSLRAILSESPPALATSIYNRSLTFFTPSAQNPQKTVLNAAYLPIQVLTTLVYSALKLDAPDVGRMIIEDWLARREPRYSLDQQDISEGDGYVKVLDIYCLHILPKLELWEYAKEFLEYEGEMPAHRREHLKSSLNNIYIQAMASRRPIQPAKSNSLLPPTPSTSSPRPYSPAPSSSSSSSSSLSTTSTHTVVPATPRGNRPPISGLTSLSHPSSSTTSISSDETATPRMRHASIPNGNGTNGHSHPQSKSRTISSSASSTYSSRHSRSSHLGHQLSTRQGSPSTYALIRASLAPYLTSTKVTTFLLLFVLVPLISFVLRMRRRRKLLATLGGGGAVAGVAAASSAVTNAELVRRRLHAASGVVESGLVQRAWGEIVRVVGDTVKMAGSGLV